LTQTKFQHMADVIIRKAKIEDIPEIYALVYELAVFEKEPEALTATIGEYEKAFSEGLLQGIVATIDQKVVGIAVFYMTFSTWKGKCLYLEDFYVQPPFRKDKIGQQLFDAYLEEAKNQGAKMTKWQVLDWNEIGLNFYHKNNAIIEKNWWNGKIFF
jgi:GNAT superfamily N-acetyltransferase